MGTQNFKGTNTYRGELRIVGQVVNNINDKEPLGYVVMVEKTQQLKVYTINQMLVLLNKFKFINAELKCGKIVNTECAMDRIPKFDTRLHIIGNFGIIILGELRSSNNNKIGYRILDTCGKIIDIKEDELIVLIGSGTPLINAKIVNRNSKKSVSAIKSEFIKIIKNNNNNEKHTKTNEAFEWRKKKHNQKLAHKLYKWVIEQSFTKYSININDKFYSRSGDTRYIDLNRETKIAFSEIFTSEYNIELTTKDKEVMKNIVNTPHKHIIKSNEKMDESTKLYILSLAQFILNDDKVFSEIKSYIVSRSTTDFSNANTFIKNSSIVSDSYKRLYKEVIKALDDKSKMRNLQIKQSKQKMFNTQTFTTEKNIQQLGFTLNQEYDKMSIKTDTGFNKTLAYVGNYIRDYDRLSSKLRCLGDILCVAYIEKLINRYGSLDNPNGQAEKYSMKKCDIRNTIEIIIAIAFMFNSQVMKEYTESIREKLQILGINLVYDEISNTDYKIHDEILLYYASGFNVFLSDSSEYDYKKEYLKSAKLINYRQLGIKHNIKHKLLQEELALTVSLLTSEECSIDVISKLIGNLRFL